VSFKASTESLVAERGRPRNGSSAKGAGAGGGVGENIVVGQKIKKGAKREKTSGNCNNNLYYGCDNIGNHTSIQELPMMI
jgi:hypothetical protein